MEMVIRMQILLFAMAAAGITGAVGMLLMNFSYKRMLKNKSHFSGLEDKWLPLWEKRDQSSRVMNRFVWYPTLASTGFFALAHLFHKLAGLRAPLSNMYVYAALGVPLMLLMLRNGLDISFQENEVLYLMKEEMDRISYHDTVGLAEKKSLVPVVPEMTRKERREQERLEKERLAKEMKERERMLNHIADGIRQSAAAGGHFKKMLTPEENAIMKEIIQEYMKESQH